MKSVMTLAEAIDRFERQLNAAQAVLDSGFGVLPGESNRVYRERKEMAEWALAALRLLRDQEGTRPDEGAGNRKEGRTE